MYDKYFVYKALVILRNTILYHTLYYMYDKTHFDRAIVRLHTIYRNIVLYLYVEYTKTLN